MERVFSVCGDMTAGKNKLSKRLETRVFLKMNSKYYIRLTVGNRRVTGQGSMAPDPLCSYQIDFSIDRNSEFLLGAVGDKHNIFHYMT